MSITTETLVKRLKSYPHWKVISGASYLPFYSDGIDKCYAPLPHIVRTNDSGVAVVPSEEDFTMWLVRAQAHGKISVVIVDGRCVEYTQGNDGEWELYIPMAPGDTVGLGEDFHKLIVDIENLHFS